MVDISKFITGTLIGIFLGTLQLWYLIFQRKKVQKKLKKATADKNFWKNLVLRNNTLNK